MLALVPVTKMEIPASTPHVSELHMRRANLFPTISVALLASVLLLTGCSTTKGGAPNPPPIVTLEKKPAWLVLGGPESVSPSGDIVHIGGKTLQLEGWIFENDDPNHDNLVVTPTFIAPGMKGIIYWKGNGSITNAGHDRVKLPLPSSEDPRTDVERGADLDQRIKQLKLRKAAFGEYRLSDAGTKVRIDPFPPQSK